MEKPCLSVTIRWRDRNGGESLYSVTNATITEAREAARRMGYPGHSGGFWNYLKDDLRALWKRLT